MRSRGPATITCNGVSFTGFTVFTPTSAQTTCSVVDRTPPNRWTVSFPITPGAKPSWPSYTCQVVVNAGARLILSNSLKEPAIFNLRLRHSAPKCPQTVQPTPTLGGRPDYPTETIPVASSIASVLVQNHWSEGVILPRPDQSNVITENALQLNCPHPESGLLRWEDAATWPNSGIPQANGQAFSIPEGRSVLVSGNSLAKSGFYGYITIPSTSRLIFADENIELHTMGMNVIGTFAIGGPQCRMTSRIRILLYGSRSAQPVPADPWVKGIHVTGVFDIHGQV